MSAGSEAGHGIDVEHTDVRVQVSLVQVLNDALDGLDGPVPVVQRDPSVQEALYEAMRGFQCYGGAHILKFPPTKNFRAMLGNWYMDSGSI